MKTPGQIAFEKFYHHAAHMIWAESSSRQNWEETAQAVLESQWRSVKDPPKDVYEVVLVAGGGTATEKVEFAGRWESRTHWMRIPKLPSELKEREEFEKWVKDNPKLFSGRQDIAWEAWQAAKASK